MIVNEIDLDQDEDLFLLHGVPFTGIGYTLDATGAKVSETPYVNGFSHGICREWYNNGDPKRKWDSVNGAVNGELIEWHRNGLIRCRILYIYGVESVYDEWDDRGIHLCHRELDPNSELANYARMLTIKNDG